MGETTERDQTAARLNVRDLQWVAVEWVDSVSMAGWRSIHAVDDLVDEDDALLQLSVGMLYRERDDRIVLLLSAGLGDDPELADAQAIPRVCIQKITPLHPARTSKLPTTSKRRKEKL